ncbi:hypothetical protein ACPC54_31850 [Kitasatospora sp. NPDC094028]
MSVIARSLVRLYPDAFRERWGAMVEDEARGAGWKSWPNLLAGIADMWLHPALWPADSPAQRQRRVATMGITVALAAWFLNHLAAEQADALPSTAADARTAITHGSTLLLLLGLALVAPRPRPTVEAALLLLRWALRRLALPTAVGTAVVLVVHSGIDTAPPTLRVAVLAGWWIALALGAIQIPRIFTGVGAEAVVPPPTRRLRAGVWTLAAASATGGAALLGSAVTDGLHPLAAAVGLGLLLLTAVCTGTLRDLRDLPPAD